MKNILFALFKGLWPFLLALVLVTLAIWAYWEWELNYPSTSDAVLYNNVVAIAPEISGTVSSVNVKDAQYVQAGTILFSLDNRQQKIDLLTAQNNLAKAMQVFTENQAAVASAKANLANAQSEMNLQKAVYDRRLSLFKSGAASPNDLDIAKQAFLAAEGNLQIAQATLNSAIAALGNPDPHLNTTIETANIALAQAQLNLSYTLIQAPTSGFLINLNLTPGQRVSANTTLFGLISSGSKTNPFQIQAYILEPFLKNIHVGQPVSFTLRTYPDQTYQGVVSGIGYGIDINDWQSNQSLPTVDSSFNWISVAKRFPIMITVTSPHDFETHPFRIGASVSVSIDTRNK